MKKYINEANKFIKTRIEPLLKSGKTLQVSPDRYTFFVKTNSVCNAKKSEVEKQIYMDLKDNKDISINIHFPVCKYVCNFCHYPKKKDGSELVQTSVNLLIKEISIFLERHSEIKNTQITSFYIGGGTPTLMNKDQLNRIFNAFEGCKFSTNCEKTIEGTPDTLSDEKINEITDIGFNRISLGIQILDDEKLISCQRMHTSEHSINTLTLLLKESGIKTNVDLIYGFPEQTPEKLLEDVRKIIKTDNGPSSITLYRLRLTKIGDMQTLIMKDYKKNPQNFPSQEQTYLMKLAASEFLKENGYIEGPIGWFHKKDEPIAVYKDRWQRQIPLFSFGWKAYSYSQNMQYQNEKIFNIYLNSINSGEEVPICGEIFTDEDKIKRKLAFFLKYGENFELEENEYKKISKIVSQLKKQQIVYVTEKDNKRSIAITKAGKVFIEEIINSYIFRGIQINTICREII